MVWENAMKKYPTVWTAMPSVCTHLSTWPVLYTKVSSDCPNHIMKNPAPIEKNASVSLNRVGLPVFLNPMYEMVPITIPTMNPTRFNMFSRKISKLHQFCMHLILKVNPTRLEFRAFGLLYLVCSRQVCLNT